jgi:hypothetical protein
VLWVEAIGAVIHEFGPEVGLFIIGLGGLALAVRVLATRLEKAYQEQLRIQREDCFNSTKELKEAHIREVSEVRAHGERGWQMATAFQANADRFGDGYKAMAEALRDLADEVAERTGRRRQGI